MGWRLSVVQEAVLHAHVGQVGHDTLDLLLALGLGHQFALVVPGDAVLSLSVEELVLVSDLFHLC